MVDIYLVPKQIRQEIKEKIQVKKTDYSKKK